MPRRIRQATNAYRPWRNHDMPWKHRSDDAGSATVELVILVPVIMVLIFAGPQLALWYYAREAAQAAAQAGTRAASAQNAPAGTGSGAAKAYLTSTGKDTISGAWAIEHNTPTTVSVEVHAAVPRVIPLPGLTFSVDVIASRARERFTTPGQP
jgi:Flp pilus assembly protein TadG